MSQVCIQGISNSFRETDCKVLGGCLSYKHFIKSICVFDFRTKERKLNLNIEFGIAVLSTIFSSRGKLCNHVCNSILKKAGSKSSHEVLSSLKKSPHKDGTIIVPSRPGSHVNSSLLFGK